MNKLTKNIIATAVLLSAGMNFTHAQALDAATQAKLDAMVQSIQTWASDPAILNATKEFNATPPAATAGMTQEKWASLPILDPLARSFTKNAAAEFLKSKKSDVLSEAFLSAADGNKVAFLSKPTNWCHKGKPKFDVPMTGKVWIGPVETDESTGLQQIQVSVPVLDGDKPVGALLVGLGVAKLQKE